MPDRQRQMRFEIDTDRLLDLAPIQTEPIGVAEGMTDAIRVLPENNALPAPHPVCLRMKALMRSIAGLA